MENRALTASASMNPDWGGLGGDFDYGTVGTGREMVGDFFKEHQSKIATGAVLAGIGLLTACGQAPTGMTPDQIGAEWWAGWRDFFASWSTSIGVGVIYGAANGAWEAKRRINAWTNRSAYLAQVGKLQAQADAVKSSGQEGAEYEAKQIERSATMARRMVNPFFSAVSVVKEAGEGFMAGAFSQIAVTEGLIKTDANSVTGLLLLANAAYWNWKALAKAG